jgi:hypothetical protein
VALGSSGLDFRLLGAEPDEASGTELKSVAGALDFFFGAIVDGVCSEGTEASEGGCEAGLGSRGLGCRLLGADTGAEGVVGLFGCLAIGDEAEGDVVTGDAGAAD